MEANILQLAARAYQELMTVEYQVVLGRKGKAHTIEIAFRADNFYHLAGLHKLKQRYPFQQQTSKWVLDHILRGTISVSSFSKDQNFYKVEERLHALCIFEKVLDSNQTQFFLYDRRKVSFATKIMANYLAKGHIENELILFSFFVQNHTRYYVNSIFPEGTYDYSQKQMQFTVLAKTKIWNERSGIKKIELYRHKKYDALS